jgi:hypothetical protein
MKEIRTQEELNCFDFSEDVILIGINDTINITSNIRIVLNNSSPTIRTWGNSSPTIETWDTSSPTIRTCGSSSPTIRTCGNSSPTIETWDTSSPTIETWGNSSPTIRTCGNSSPTIETWDNSRSSHYGNKITPRCFANSILITDNQKMNADAHIIIQQNKEYDFFERHGIDKADSYILYKRVSIDFKTQEETANETLWTIGSTVAHKSWNPVYSECGEGKFHAVARPFFADQYRGRQGDRYVCIKIKSEDLYEWKNAPSHPHKIGFREGIVLYECDRDGNNIGD